MTDPAKHSLLAVYKAAAGRSEVPPALHLWCSLALLSATLADRVWIQKFGASRLVPNLYVMFIAGSGEGKGTAMKMMARLAADVSRIRMHNGIITAQRIYQKLAMTAGKDPNGPPQGKLFLVAEELGMSVGEGPQARDFVKYLTGLYDAGAPYPLTKGTATDGDIVVKNHCLTFLGGTDKPWLVESVSRSAIEGGFFARMAVIKAAKDYALRITRPEFPPNYDDLMGHLVERLRLLSFLEGPIVSSPEFLRVEDEWYRTRPRPDDEIMLPSWNREHDMILKLVTILVACDPLVDGVAPRLVAEPRHWQAALWLARQAMQAIPEVVSFAGQTPEAARLERTTTVVRTAYPQWIHHSVLLRRVSGYGIDAPLLDRHVATLLEARRIHRLGRKGGRDDDALRYRWVKREQLPALSEIPPTPEEGEGDDDDSV